MIQTPGSAAIHYAIVNLAQAGDNIVTTPQLYGGTYTLFAHMLPKLGIEVRFAASDLESSSTTRLARCFSSPSATR